MGGHDRSGAAGFSSREGAAGRDLAAEAIEVAIACGASIAFCLIKTKFDLHSGPSNRGAGDAG